MDKFSDFISEQKNDKPYRILNLIHDTPDDPNKTGDMIEKEAKKMGIDCYQLKIDNGYFTVNEKGNLVAHNFIHEKEVVVTSPSDTKTIHDKKGWEVNPENTIHPLLIEHNIDAVPFKHKNIDIWRSNFKGIRYKSIEHNYDFGGAVDDIWQKKMEN